MQIVFPRRTCSLKCKKNVRKMNKSKLVDINTLVGTFEEAVRYALKLNNK